MTPMRLLDSFLAVHRHPLNRACHAAGAACLLGATACLSAGRWRAAAALAAAGAALIGGGHVFEGEPPALVKHWLRRSDRG